MADLLPLITEAATASASNAADGHLDERYSYPPGESGLVAADVLHALRRFHAAESEMRKRSRQRSSLNDTDLSALRYLISARAGQRSMGARDLAAVLEISPASVSVMLERLERRGYVTRAAHPSDRRASLVEPTDAAEAEVTATVGALHERMLEVAESLTPDEIVAVHRFLTAMATVVRSAESHRT